MSGIPLDNIPSFLAAQEALTNLGYETCLPKDMDNQEAVSDVLAGRQETLLGTLGMTWGQALAGDVPLVADTVGGVVLLEGWEKSRGARLEAYVGLLTGKIMWEFHDNNKEVYLEELKHGYVAGVCAAQWVSKETLQKLGLAA